MNTYYTCERCNELQDESIRYHIGEDDVCKACYDDAVTHDLMPPASVERYRIGYYTGQGRESAAAHSHPNGEYVTYSDYAALAERVQVLDELVEAWSEYKTMRKDYEAWSHTRTHGQNMTHPVHEAWSKMDTIAAQIKEQRRG